jgi:hypothetical protein
MRIYTISLAVVSMENTTNTDKKDTGSVKRRKKRRPIRRMEQGLILFLVFIALFSHLTNPYTFLSVIKEPFKIAIQDTELVYSRQHPIYTLDVAPIRLLGNLKDTWHILANQLSFFHPTIKANSIDDIIDSIHWARFSTQKPYLISGDHFSILYPRSLGIFYQSVLDPRTARSETDWLRRQIIYLKTALYALETYAHTKELSTTIVPIGPLSVTLVNHFFPPSDTLYSLLFAIEAMRSPEELQSLYPYNRLDQKQYTLATVTAANTMLSEYKDTLKRHYDTYSNDVTDPKSGLIKTSIHLSGEKDSVERESAFYDNVMLWKTKELAQRLEIIPKDAYSLTQLRQKILTEFWDPQQGYFLEDLSANAKNNHWYSSDWLVAVMTGFLKPENPEDQEYIKKSIQFIQKEKLDRPFALKFQPDAQPSNLYWLVKIAAQDYGTHAIWSNLGMEYTKLLIHMYQVTCNNEYLTEARYQLDQYKNNILKYKGFPEVYDQMGNMYHIKLYTSVRATGWVVNFEEADAMYASTKKSNSVCLPTTDYQ